MIFPGDPGRWPRLTRRGHRSSSRRGHPSWTAPARSGSSGTAGLRSACQLLTRMKYRVDDFMDALWCRQETSCSEISAEVLRDPLFRLLGITSASLVPDGIDWLEAVGRDPAVEDDLWLARRAGLDTRATADLRTNAAMTDRSLLYGIAPHSFARLVLPSDPDGEQYRRLAPEGMTLAEIDPRLVIGGTYQPGWPACPGTSELDAINARAAAAAPGLDTAYVQVGRLPLYVALEGKNRVRAFRAAGKAITGFTSMARFPEPNALELHEIASWSGTAPADVAVSNDAGAVQVLPLPGVTVPLLEAYGVPWGWPLPADSPVRAGGPLRPPRGAALSDLVRHFMHP